MKFILVISFHSVFSSASFRKFSTNDWFKLQHCFGYSKCNISIYYANVRQGLLKEI